MSVERHFKGAAAVAKLTAELGGTDNDRVLSMSTTQGWDFGPYEIFEVAVDRGLPSEEKMLCHVGSRNPDGTGSLTVYVDPNTGKAWRGYDDTVIQRHLVGAKVEHVWTATDAREVFHALKTLDNERAADDGTWGALLGSPPPLVP